MSLISLGIVDTSKEKNVTPLVFGGSYRLPLPVIRSGIPDRKQLLVENTLLAQFLHNKSTHLTRNHNFLKMEVGRCP